MSSPRAHDGAAGFTIIELLIVIIVIGILATLILIGYNNISSGAKVSALKADLTQSSKQLGLDKERTGNGTTYPATALAANGGAGLGSSNGTTYQYTTSGSGQTAQYCLTATNGNVSYFITSPTTSSPYTTAASASPGACPGHYQNGASAIYNLQMNPKLATDSSGYSNQTPSGGVTSRTTGTGPSGEATYNVMTTASGQLRIAFKPATPTLTVTQNETYTISFYLYSDVAVSGATVEVNYGTPWVATSIANITTGWQRYSTVATVPAGSTSIGVAQLLTTSSVPASANFKMTKVMITKGSTLYGYADGDSLGWSWSGTANLSSSSGPGQ